MKVKQEIAASFGAGFWTGAVVVWAVMTFGIYFVS
jgi:hypothetical protein